MLLCPKALLLMVLCVPVSYLVGVLGQRCCGARSEAELEMEKMDKIYQEVRKNTVTCYVKKKLMCLRTHEMQNAGWKFQSLGGDSISPEMVPGK